MKGNFQANAGVSRKLVGMAVTAALEEFLTRWRAGRRRFGLWEVWPVAKGIELASGDASEAMVLLLAQIRLRLRNEGFAAAVNVQPVRKVRGAAGWTLGFRVTLSPVSGVRMVKKERRRPWPAPLRWRTLPGHLR